MRQSVGALDEARERLRALARSVDGVLGEPPGSRLATWLHGSPIEALDLSEIEGLRRAMGEAYAKQLAPADEADLSRFRRTGPTEPLMYHDHREPHERSG